MKILCVLPFTLDRGSFLSGQAIAFNYVLLIQKINFTYTFQLTYFMPNSFSPTQTWGTQETIWPLSQAAKTAQATPRLEDLATPKKNFQTGVHSGRYT